MTSVTAAKWTALIGYALSGTGVVLFSQLDRIENLSAGHEFLNATSIASLVMTCGGFVTAIVGSVMWARRTPTTKPFKIAGLIGVASLFLSLVVRVNVHGPSAILMFIVLF